MKSGKKYNRHKRSLYKTIKLRMKLYSIKRAAANKLHVKGNPLNIAMFTDTYPPDINGVSISVLTLTESLRERGHNVYVFTTTEDTKFSGISIEDQTIRISSVRLKKFYGYGLSKPFSIRGINYLRKLKIDVIHIHTDFTLRIIGETCAGILDIPVVYTYHTMYEDYTNYVSKYTRGHFENTLKRFAKWFSKTSNNHCAKIISPSEKTKKALIRYGVTAGLSVIPTGIDLSKFMHTDSEKLESLKKKFDLADRFCAVYLGRIAKEKSIEVLIEAMKEVVKTDTSILLLIIGYGPYEDELKKHVKECGLEDNVRFLGKAGHDEVPLYYKLGDIFVSASKSETQGITYIEALASSLPVLAQYDECIKDIINEKENINGNFFRDTKTLIKLILKYKNMDKVEYNIICKNAKDSTERFSIQAFGAAVEEVYEDVVEKFELKMEN